jgi:WD40 repeat protein
LIVSAGWDKNVRLWDLEGNPIGKTFKDNTAGVNTAIFSPAGKYVVTAGKDGSVRWWDLNANKGRKLVEHKGEATSAVFSPDSRYILTGGKDETVRLLTLNNFLVFEFKEMMDTINSVSFSPDGKYIIIAPARGPAQLRLVDLGEIIDIVNLKGNVRDLREDEISTYNLHPGNQAQAPGVKK